MKFLFFKNDPLISKLPLYFPTYEIIGLDYRIFFEDNVEPSYYADFSKHADAMEIDSVFIFRKFKVDNDPLIDLILKADFLGLDVNQYFLNKGIDKVNTDFQSHIDYVDANNMLIISDKISGSQFDQLIEVLIATKDMYNKFYDND
ncbi:MAG: hypothetical protein ISR00_05435 [Flavobacteriales bacterium]|nr:hypothetical protein [Flavobacteriales bacterium]MBL6873376.1 hypothetical protein [Flavobacteriales bacterium]